MRVVLWIFAVIGALSVLIFAACIYGIVHFANSAIAMKQKPVQIADTTVLELDFEQELTDSNTVSLDGLLDEKSVSFTTILHVLERGGADPRIKGAIIRAGSVPLGLAQVQELRDAIKEFRAKGKFAFAFGDSYGELGGGTRAYYLANAFDEIWLQPGGSLGLVGIDVEAPFFRGTLDKLGIEPVFGRRGEFKTAAAQFTESKMPATDHLAMSEMLGSIYDEVAAGIAEGRKIDPAAAKQLIDGGPYIGDDALAKHLVDHIGYRDQAVAAARLRAGAGAQLMGADAYDRATRVNLAGKPVIALIRVTGEIHGGASPDGLFDTEESAGADTVVRALQEAAGDPDVRAVILRIDSPGGSSTASETIWHAVKRAEEAGKPVIVSMSNTAASGGYYIAAGADKIVAEPGTLTGSIGVFAGKFVLNGLYDKLGINFESIAFGHNATMESSLSDFTPEQRQRFDQLLDQTYKQFVAHVADGRHIDPVKAESIARGRVWTGAQAKSLGLVDALGGMEIALKLAKEAGRLPPNETPQLRNFPRPATTFEKILANITHSSDEMRQSSMVLHRLSGLAPFLSRLDQLGLSARGDTEMQPMHLAD